MDKRNTDIDDYDDDEEYGTTKLSLYDEFLMLEHETEEEYDKRLSSIKYDISEEDREASKKFIEDMLADYRVNGKHLLDKNHRPVTALGYMPDDEFVDVLFNLSKGNGFVERYGNCEFVKVSGKGYIKFSIELYSVVPRQKVVLLDYQTFYYYLKIACDFHINRFKEDEEIVKKHLKAYRENFNVIDEDIT